MINGAARPLGEALQSSCGWTVYACLAEDGTMLYVGMTSRGSGRLAQHVGKPWWVAVDRIHLFHFETGEEARREEAEFIAVLKPLFNINARPVGPPSVMESFWDLKEQIREQDLEIMRLKDELAALQEFRGDDV